MWFAVWASRLQSFFFFFLHNISSDQCVSSERTLMITELSWKHGGMHRYTSVLAAHVHVSFKEDRSTVATTRTGLFFSLTLRIGIDAASALSRNN